MFGRDAKAWSTALSTALETLEAIDLDSWFGCVALFCDYSRGSNPRAKSRGYLLLIKLNHGFTDIK